ncbi:MAG TPA: hypothetical protein VGI45_26235, partial [Terracidiphilus sp.]
AALEFIQHHLAKSGHVCLLVTTTYPSRRSNRRPTPQRPPRSGLVQTVMLDRILRARPVL